jgi:NTP pyrophosphatase (non-canonical NTP hydrolase)
VAIQDALLQEERLSAYQQFHRHLDDNKDFDPDLFFNYILLTEEMGEIAKELVKIWKDSQRMASDGRPLEKAQQEAINKNRANLRNELADLLAYTLKLANFTGIDLEQAYLDKMKHNIGRDWTEERPLP